MQQIACMGSWDFYIPTRALHWSDEVFRIVGFQPQAFMPTDELFMQNERAVSVDASFNKYR